MSITRIAFASCFRYEAFPQQPEWADIDAIDPDYLFLLGDHIYMDYGFWPFSREWSGRPRQYSDKKFEAVMAEKYRKQWSEKHFAPLYKKLREKNAIYGIWDDHDFAWNNATGNAVPQSTREIAYRLFNERFPCTIDGEIYQSFDTPHAHVVLLDVRSHSNKQPITYGEGTIVRPPDTILGADQFKFLENDLLSRCEKPFTIICSSLTLRLGGECWLQFPGDFQRLMDLISQSGRKVVFLAGDIHRNHVEPPSKHIPCYEIISSGLAVNYYGNGLSDKDDRHNWGLLTFEDGKDPEVRLIENRTWSNSRPLIWP